MKYLCFILSIICFSYTAPAAGLDQALIEAAKNGQLTRVHNLLKQGADVSATDGNGQTALMWATAKSKLDMVVALDRGVKFASQGRNQAHSMWGNEWVYDQIVSVLLLAKARERRKDRDSAEQLQRNADLIQAARSGQTERILALLKAGADIDTLFQGKSPLVWAAFWGHPQVVKILLDAGADVNFLDSKGFNALMWAQERGHRSVVDLLDEYASSE